MTMNHDLSRRRQNTSCDPCRRAKRRCFFSPSGNAPGEICCVNCQHHGRHCTFEFAASKTTSKRSRGLERSSPHSPQVEGSNVLHQADEGFTNALSEDAWASWLDLDAGQYNSVESNHSSLSERRDLVDTSLTSPAPADSIIQTENHLTRRTPETPPAPATYPRQSLVGRSSNSPIYLLSTKVDATILEDRLSKIHDVIVTGCASRFVDFDCNLYATASRYRLDNGGTDQTPQSSNPCEKSLSVPTQPLPSLQMTSLGIVRFLDHFSGLYGNRLSPSDRGLSAKALKTVLRAFSMQWLSTDQSDSLNNAYHDTWFEARSILQSAQSVRSFRTIYAILPFDGIAIPIKAKQSVAPHEFLNAGLESLQYLQGLVNEYCAILGSHSTYRALLEASLSVVSWAGYIRDIGAALTGDHSCQLPSADYKRSREHGAIQLDSSAADRDIHELALGSSSGAISYQDLDRGIPATCRRAVAQAFHAWRQIIKVKELALKCSLSLVSDVVNTIAAVEDFNHTFRPFMNRCIETLEHLSTGSKASSVSITLFWDLGVLILAESINTLDTNLISQIQPHRLEAISSVTQTAQRLLSLPPEEAFNLQNGLRVDVPIISYHITPGLTAMTFEKAIEAMIDVPVNNELQGNILDDAWKHQVDSVMKSLASLNATVGGEQVVKAAFNSLMQRHGDVLSECWTEVDM